MVELATREQVQLPKAKRIGDQESAPKGGFTMREP